MDLPWHALSEAHRQWVLEGEPDWVDWGTSWPGVWYGVRRFFDWLEGKSYKMHIRVLLSKYRSYTECPSCGSVRIKPEALLWRLKSGGRRLNIYELSLLPITRATWTASSRCWAGSRRPAIPW